MYVEEFSLSEFEMTKVNLAPDAKILGAGTEKSRQGSLFLWAEVDGVSETKLREFVPIRNYHAIPRESNYKVTVKFEYIDTVFMNSRAIHIYERIVEKNDNDFR